MLRAGFLGLLLALVGALVGCLEGRAPLGELDELRGAPGPEDVALCQALADRQRVCVDDEAEPFDVDGCASRYVCSRQLWREDIQEAVYECLQEQSCDEEDLEFSCLREAMDELAPSTAQQVFEQEAEAADELCGTLLDVAPGQSDLVYEALTFCLTQNEDCDSKAACSLATLDTLVDAICGVPLDG